MDFLPNLNNGDTLEGIGYVAIVPKFGPLLIFTLCSHLVTPKKGYAAILPTCAPLFISPHAEHFEPLSGQGVCSRLAQMWPLLIFSPC